MFEAAQLVAGKVSRQSAGKGWSISRKWYKMSTFEEFRPEFEISLIVKSVDIHAFEVVYPIQHSGVVSFTINPKSEVTFTVNWKSGNR